MDKAYSDQPDRDSLDGNVPSSSGVLAPPPPAPPPVLPPHNKEKKHKKKKNPLEPKFKPPKKEKEKPMMDDAVEMREKTAPCSHLWVSLSSMYGKVVVILMIAFCITEVMDNTVEPLTFQTYYMLYLYGGSILSIIIIYISVVIENFGSFRGSKEQLTGDPESGSLSSLRRAHISRKKTPRTSFYLRVGALVFGFGTLIFNGLEIAMHATAKESCVSDLVFAHPTMQALFTFLQMHFLFVNSEVLVEKFGLLARFSFMHLVATNLAVWVRMVIWESAIEWLHHVNGANVGASEYLPSPSALHEMLPQPAAQRRQYYRPRPPPYRSNPGYYRPPPYNDRSDERLPYDSSYGESILHPMYTTPLPACNNSLLPVSEAHMKRVTSLYNCFNDNNFGQMWTSSLPYLFPFLVEYSLIAAAVTYVMWKNVGREKLASCEGKKIVDDDRGTLDKKTSRKGRYLKIDCQGATKGLFLGVLSLLGGVVVVIVFFVMRHQLDFKENLFYIGTLAQIVILGASIAACLVGFVQVPKLSLSGKKPLDLDELLQSTTVVGVYLFSIFGMIVGGLQIPRIIIEEYNALDKHILVFVTNALLAIQVTLQGMLLAEAGRRVCATKYQTFNKHGRQAITFLLFANVTLWLLDTCMTHTWVSQELQLGYYGLLAWGIISRLSLPLVIFYRFHSAVVLMEVWKKTYGSKDY